MSGTISNANANLFGGREDDNVAAEVMDLAFDITQTSALIFEMVADLAPLESAKSPALMIAHPIAIVSPV